MADKVGVFNRLGYAATGVTTATAEFEFMEGSSLGLSENFIDANQMRGTRAHASERVRRGTRRVDGTINMAPNPAELAVLFPVIFGTPASGTTFALAESVPLFNLFAVRDGTVYTCSDCCVESATLSASEGGPMQLSMTVVGKDEAASGSMGAVVPDVAAGPFVLHDAAVSVASGARQVSGFELTIRNVLETKYRNSATLTQIVATDRIITLSLPISLGTDSALYGSALAGVAATITLTNGTVSCLFSMAAVQAPKAPLPFGQRGILDFPWQGVARKSGSTLELVTTLDSTV
jgi:hypothetical protein